MDADDTQVEFSCWIIRETRQYSDLMTFCLQSRGEFGSQGVGSGGKTVGEAGYARLTFPRLNGLNLSATPHDLRNRCNSR
jgi:hypothetical protein